jgi:hypothetical protein
MICINFLGGGICCSLEAYSRMKTTVANRARIADKKFTIFFLLKRPLFRWEGEQKKEGLIRGTYVSKIGCYHLGIFGLIP